MKKIVMATATAAVVIMAVAGVYAAVYEPASDYTLLDSTDNIQPGMVCKVTQDTVNMHAL